MSWSLVVLPLHELARDGGLEWAASAGFSRGVPDQAPDPVPLVRVVDVLEAFRESACHGTAWFEVEDVDAPSWLPTCPSPQTCGSAGGLDLGEVSLHVVGQVERDQPVRSDARVEGVSFRKPSGAAALRAVCALTVLAGPLLVCDDSGDRVFVVWPQERPEDLAEQWLW